MNGSNVEVECVRVWRPVHLDGPAKTWLKRLIHLCSTLSRRVSVTYWLGDQCKRESRSITCGGGGTRGRGNILNVLPQHSTHYNACRDEKYQNFHKSLQHDLNFTITDKTIFRNYRRLMVGTGYTGLAVIITL